MFPFHVCKCLSEQTVSKQSFNNHNNDNDIRAYADSGLQKGPLLGCLFNQMLMCKCRREKTIILCSYLDVGRSVAMLAVTMMQLVLTADIKKENGVIVKRVSS